MACLLPLSFKTLSEFRAKRALRKTQQKKGDLMKVFLRDDPNNGSYVFSIRWQYGCGLVKQRRDFRRKDDKEPRGHAKLCLV